MVAKRVRNPMTLVAVGGFNSEMRGEALRESGDRIFTETLFLSTNRLLLSRESAMVIDREREKERKFLHLQIRSAKKSAEDDDDDDDDAATWFARLLSSLSSSLPCAPSDGPCRKKRPLSEPEISEIWEQWMGIGMRSWRTRK